MAFDEELAARVRRAIARRKGIQERKMFGGLAFLLHGNMSCGLVGEDLMVRVGADNYEEALEDPRARPMDFTGRPMKGYVYVDGAVDDEELTSWVRRGLAFARTLPSK